MILKSKTNEELILSLKKLEGNFFKHYHRQVFLLLCGVRIGKLDASHEEEQIIITVQFLHDIKASRIEYYFNVMNDAYDFRTPIKDKDKIIERIYNEQHHLSKCLLNLHRYFDYDS